MASVHLVAHRVIWFLLFCFLLSTPLLPPIPIYSFPPIPVRVRRHLNPLHPLYAAAVYFACFAAFAAFASSTTCFALVCGVRIMTRSPPTLPSTCAVSMSPVE